MEHILSLDAGTGSIRAVLFNKEGKQLGVAQQEWTHHTDPRYPGSMDFAWEANWEKVVNCIREVLRTTGIPPSTIKALSATSMREGLVLYDEDGREVWACANVDARAGNEVKELKERDEHMELDIYNMSGQTYALGAIPRLLWLKKHEPKTYEKVACMTMINDWILYRLSGVLQVDPSNGCTTGLFDLESRGWKVEIAERCGLKATIFPPVHEAGKVIGTVSEEAASRCGLSPSTLVVAGGGDAQMATVGAGAIANEQTVVSGGSFWQQEVNIKEPLVDKSGRIRVNCHAVEGLWQLEAIGFFPGLVMRWFRDAFCQEEQQKASFTGRDAYEILEEKARTVPVGSNGILPIFSDTMNYIAWRHAAPSFLNLSLDAERTGKMEMFKSLQENAALVTLGNLLLIKESTGFFPKEVIFVGGASKGKLWSQTLADVLGVPVRVPVVKEAAALGTAMFAGLGAGMFASIEEAAATLVEWERTYMPDLENHKTYLEIYEKWRKVYIEQLKLADIGLTSHMWKAPGL